jgi:hypothetical protein
MPKVGTPIAPTSNAPAAPTSNAPAAPGTTAPGNTAPAAGQSLKDLAPPPPPVSSNKVAPDLNSPAKSREQRRKELEQQGKHPIGPD